MKRSSEEYILIALSFGASISILPFAIVRILNREWFLAATDSVMVVGMFVVGIYVYLTRQTRFASAGLSFVAVAGVVTVIHLKGYALLYWVYPTMIGVFFILTPGIAFIITLVGVIILIPALARDMDTMGFIAALMTLVVTNYFAYVFSSRMYEQSQQLIQLVRKDPLTGVGNRRALEEQLEECANSQKRINMTASLLMIDLDHFKRVNDVYGHIVGDQVLIKLVEIINSRIRISDKMYRFGGEEFVIIAVGTNATSAEILSEDLRTMVESATLLPETVTISIGIAEYVTGESSEDWLHRCDGALYRAKHMGRNKVFVFDSKTMQPGISANQA